jgi:hypothetical protein
MAAELALPRFDNLFGVDATFPREFKDCALSDGLKLNKLPRRTVDAMK